MVFVLDALIYTLTNWPKSLINQSLSTSTVTSQPSPAEETDRPEAVQMEHAPSQTETTAQDAENNRENFFKRSESILSGAATDQDDPETVKSNQKFFGPPRALLESPDLVGPPNPWGVDQAESSFSRPLSEAFPLAQQPHLLKPYAKKEHLFSSPARVREATDGGGKGGGREPETSRQAGPSLPVSYTKQKER